MATASFHVDTDSVTKAPTIFDCPICLEEVKSPRYLSCKHLYCETCLKAYIEGTAKNIRKSGWTFCCPVCRAKFSAPKPSTSIEKWVSELPKNKVTQAIISENKSKGKTSYTCDPCDRVGEHVMATHWCRHCSELLCANCLETFHKRIKDASCHGVVKLSETVNFPEILDGDSNEYANILEPCTEHKGKFYEAFCLSHSELCCVDCLVFNHSSCTAYKTLDEITASVLTRKSVAKVVHHLKSVDHMLQKLIDKRKRQLTGIENEATRVVLDAAAEIDQIIAKLENLKSEIKSHVLANYGTAIQSRKHEVVNLNSLQDDLAKEINILDNVDQQSDDRKGLFALLKTQNAYEQRYKGLLEAIWTAEEPDSVHFSVHLSSLLTKFTQEKEDYFEMRKSSSRTDKKDKTKLEIETEVNELNDIFESLVRNDVPSGDEPVNDTAGNAPDKSEDFAGHGVYIFTSRKKVNKKKYKK